MKNQIYKWYVEILRTHFAARTRLITVRGEPFFGSSMSVQDRPRQCTYGRGAGIRTPIVARHGVGDRCLTN